jgi:cardiolipin synthase
MRNLANAITLLRIGLVPLIAWELLQREPRTALALLAVSALSDLVDGLVARRWGERTRFGAIADPLADKLTMTTVTLILAFQSLLPWWFVAAAVTRDAVIVGGALAYHRLIGPLEVAPSGLSKLNTALEFLLVTGTLAIGAGLLAEGPWLAILLTATIATIAISGTHYVFVWSRKALDARRRAR